MSFLDFIINKFKFGWCFWFKNFVKVNYNKVFVEVYEKKVIKVDGDVIIVEMIDKEKVKVMVVYRDVILLIGLFMLGIYWFLDMSLGYVGYFMV